jgi:sulfite reductase (NADPH) flavoprotein alpha-component
MNSLLHDPKLSKTQDELLKSLVQTLTVEQKLWLGGYLTGMHESTRFLLETFKSIAVPANTAGLTNSPANEQFKILYGTRSGNSLKVARNASEFANTKGISSHLMNLNDYNPKDIKKETNVLIVVSTDGEGEPPPAAEEFYQYIMSAKAPRLDQLKYSVLALGDSSYKHFCKIGKDIDERLTALGALRITNRADCDIDFEENANAWITGNLVRLTTGLPKYATGINEGTTESISPKQLYSKTNAFHAPIIDRIKLNGRGSGKSIYHIELSLENSGITYAPGDALGIFCKNEESLADEIIQFLGFNGKNLVSIGDKEMELKEALLENFEISNLTPSVVELYAKKLNNNALNSLIHDKDELFKYTFSRDIFDLIQEFPSKLSPEEFISVLRKLQPRLYSIASSQNAYTDEVHLTVAKLNYIFNGRVHQGVCSNYLSKIADDSKVSVYIDENISFRLPQEESTPLIMVGAGTGIAPYRAFMQERVYKGSSGKNWLFFGERNFTTDFLYQTEWQKLIKNKSLTRMDIAFSRDQAEKKYVQHKLLENKKEVFRWIADGAHIYVCGDKNGMARDVKTALYQIIKEENNCSAEKAVDYYKQLKKEMRYHEDVY